MIDLRDSARPLHWSHGEVDRAANGVALALLGRGLRRGAHVAILAFNRAEYIVAYFGIMRAGLVAVPVNTKLPRETVDAIMDDADIALAFVDAAHRALVRPGIPVIDFDAPDGFAQQIVPGAFDAIGPEPDETAQMLYTSGSTGRPKGVPLSHAGQIWAVSARAPASGGENERFIVAQPLFHMNGLFLTKSAFITNASLVVLPGFEVRSYAQAMAAHRVTAAIAVPTMFARLVKETELLARLDLSAVRRIMLGSAPLTRALLDRVQAAFPQAAISYGYGTTEAGPAVFGSHPDGRPTPPLSIGYPICSDDVRLLDGTSPDEGVLAMRNPAVMRGYHNLPEPTAKALRGGWYSSGDVVRRDADGFFYFVGRADDMFVCSGENIYPGEVEKLLESHPAVAQVSVVPLADEERGQMPVAFVVVRPEQSLTGADLKTYALAHGPAYQHPRRIAFLTELPWAGTNKIDRKALIDRASQLEAEDGWDA